MKTCIIWLFSDPTLAIAGGKIVASFFWMLVSVVGSVCCIVVARRKKANTKCLLGLLFLFIAVIFIQVSNFFPKPLSLIFMGGFVVFGLLSLFLAVQGLIEVAKNRELYRQGKAQAIWTLVLSAYLWTMFGVGIYQGIKDRYPAPPTLEQPSPDGYIVREDLNYRFKVPQKPWIQIDAEKLNPVASLAVIRSNPHTFLMIIAQKMGIESGYNRELTAEMIKANLLSSAQQSKLVVESPLELAGIDGIHLVHEVYLQNTWLIMNQWGGYHNGYLFQIHLWGEKKYTTTIRDDASRLFGYFEVIDPERVAHSPGSEPIQDFVSPRFGYEVKLRNPRWSRWSDLVDSNEYAEFGARFHDFIGLCVFAAHLDGKEPPVEALVQAMLSCMDLSPANAEIRDMREIERGLLKGRAFNYSQTVDEALHQYKMQVLSGRGFVYMLMGWARQDEVDQLVRVDEAFSEIFFPEEVHAPAEYNDREKITQAQVMNQIGLYYYEKKQYEEAVPYFQAARGYNNKNAVYLTNVADAFANAEHYKEGLEAMLRCQSHFPGNQEVLSWLAYFQMNTEEDDDALKTYEGMFASGYKSREDHDFYLGILKKKGMYGKALEALQEYHGEVSTVELQVERSFLYFKMEEHEQAIRMLQEFQEGKPFNTDLAFELDDHYYALGMYHEAIEICDRIIVEAPGFYYALYRKGRSENALKWYGKAKDSLEQALKLAPDDTTIKDLMASVSGKLGQGNNYLIKDRLEPVPIPESLLMDPCHLQVDWEALDCNAVYAQEIHALRYDAQGEYRSTYYSLIRIRNRAGMDLFSSFTLSFDPLNERVFLNELSVLDPSGKVISTVDVNDCYVMDDTSSGYATHDKDLIVPVSGLEPGCFIRFKSTRDKTHLLEEYPYKRYFLCRSSPVQEFVITYEGDPARIRWTASEGIEVKEDEKGLTWTLDNPPVYHQESYQQLVENFLPHVCLADGKATWAAEGLDYLETIKDRLEIDGETIAQAESLVEGMTDGKEKIRTLCEFVQKEFTYQGIEFGRRAMIPNPCKRILKDKYGDCKDHALLLHMLLKACGIESRLALVNTYDLINKDLPSLDVFNHVIVALDVSEKSRFVDCTDKETYVMLPVPYGLGGSTVLILDEEEPFLASIPAYSEEHCRITLDRSATLLEGNDLFVEETLACTGYKGSWMRYSLMGCESARRNEKLQQMMEQCGASIQLKTVKVENLDAFDQPLILRLGYYVLNQFNPDEDKLIGRIPCPWERFYIGVDYMETRKNPFEFEFPLHVETSLQVHLPEGWIWPGSKKINGEKESDFTRWRLAQDEGAPSMALAFEFYRKVGQHPASRYDECYRDHEEALHGLERNFVFERE